MLAPPCTRMQAAFSLYFWKRLEVHYKDFLEVMKKEFSNPEYRGHFFLDACEKRSPSGARLIDDPQDAGKFAAPRLPLTSCVICCSLNTPDMHRPLDVFSAASAQLHQVP